MWGWGRGPGPWRHPNTWWELVAGEMLVKKNRRRAWARGWIREGFRFRVHSGSKGLTPWSSSIAHTHPGRPPCTTSTNPTRSPPRRAGVEGADPRHSGGGGDDNIAGGAASTTCSSPPSRDNLSLGGRTARRGDGRPGHQPRARP